MSQLGVILQESLQRDREARTILRFLREQMDGVDRERRRRSFKERLGFKVIGCCGATWGLGSTNMSVRDDDDEVDVEEEAEQQQERAEATNSGHNPDPGCVYPSPVSSGMNLAAALAAERHFRAAQEPEGGGGNMTRHASNAGLRSPGTPLRVSLMRLLEEAEGGEAEEEKGGVETGNDSVCCVCMGRKKGAAFIPCGHTFCRVCSRELWLNRGSCPLCNRSILEILDIF
ncbi:Zinc finger, RING-type [Corchorus capsularis]|uniref:Zinc finger, RING-type n=1 Tax=Corchorus capsularis TaxID=210143 RepID=A0A1R3I2S4_COCAP|nr:Zinc finger, RING-type [Corchorus capsularis]